MNKGTILYVGGFQLPDKNAAALRVIANAKAFRDLDYRVIFVNALINNCPKEPRIVNYEGFECYEYKREPQIKYLLGCKKIISFINKAKANIVIAYNYPSVALNKLRKYCQRNKIKCYADVTEWYVPTGNIVFKAIKGFDSEFRMRYVHKKMDGVIAISKYLYQYYKDSVKTIKVPPLVDLKEPKWNIQSNSTHEGIKLIYAGSPSAQKEKLDYIVDVIENINSENTIHLDVVGITKEQYNFLYSVEYSGTRVNFHGRIPNYQVIKMIKESDWAVVLRENNKVVKAGFPTKITESITCGTPVIANRFSNIDEYLDKNNGLLLENELDFVKTVTSLHNIKIKPQRDIFDFRNYKSVFKEFMSK